MIEKQKLRGAKIHRIRTEATVDANLRIIDRVTYRPDVTSVRLSDGKILSRSDLPPRRIDRWVASQKAAVVRVFLAGLIPKDEVLIRYALSEDELEIWVKNYLRGGCDKLKVKAIPER